MKLRSLVEEVLLVLKKLQVVEVDIQRALDLRLEKVLFWKKIIF